MSQSMNAAGQHYLLQAIDLKKHYPVKKGFFAPERAVKALDGVLHPGAWQNAGGGGGIRVR